MWESTPPKQDRCAVLFAIAELLVVLSKVLLILIVNPRDCYSYRLIAYDHGLMSFVDVTFNSWPVVLITNPKNALFLVPGHEPTHRIKRSTYIRFTLIITTLCSDSHIPCSWPRVGPGHPSSPLSIYFLIFSPFTFLFLSLALPISFFCPSLPFLPE